MNFPMTNCLYRSALLVSLLSAPSIAQQTYRLTILAPLPTGDSSWAWSINSEGQVAGSSELDGTLETTMVRWDGSSIVDLGTLPGYAHAWGHAINNEGTVAGASFGAFLGGKGRRPVLHDGFQLIDLQLGYVETSLFDIDDQGRAVGVARLDPLIAGRFAARAWMWNGAFNDLGNLGGRFARALALNESGQVVGGSDTADGRYHAFLHDGTMTDLGTLGGRRSEATDINERGQIVGWAEQAHGARRAFLFRGRRMVELGTLGGLTSEAQAINDDGVVVGTARDPHGSPRAFVFHRGVQPMTDLNQRITNLGDFLVQHAQDVNQSGQIVGWGRTASGDTRAFRLDPQ